MLNLAGRTRSLAQSSSRHVASRRAAQRGSAEAELAAEREPTAYLLELFGLPQAGVRELSARRAARRNPNRRRKLANYSVWDYRLTLASHGDLDVGDRLHAILRPLEER